MLTISLIGRRVGGQFRKSYTDPIINSNNVAVYMYIHFKHQLQNTKPENNTKSTFVIQQDANNWSKAVLITLMKIIVFEI